MSPAAARRPGALTLAGARLVRLHLTRHGRWVHEPVRGACAALEHPHRHSHRRRTGSPPLNADLDGLIDRARDGPGDADGSVLCLPPCAWSWLGLRPGAAGPV